MNKNNYGEIIRIFPTSIYKTQLGLSKEDRDMLSKEIYEQEKKSKIDLYFDEIHKGGSSDLSREILQEFLDSKFKIDIFVMVTATFAKPTIAYEGFLENQTPVVLQWGYEDQQLMKNIDINEINIEIIKKYRNNEIDRLIIDKLLEEYNIKYGVDYLNILAGEYKKHPELVLINPQTLPGISNFFEDRNMTDTIFKLKEKAIDYTDKDSLGNYKDIFEQSSSIEDLLNSLISPTKRDSESQDTNMGNGLFHFLEHEIEEKMQIQIYSGRPTQLWFLPVTNLYNNDCDAKFPEGFKKYKEIEGEVQLEEGNEQKKDSRPHIEPITRGLALAIMKNPILKKNYNVLIVHNDEKLFNLSGIKSDSINCIVSSSNTNLVDEIKKYEC